MYVHSQVFVVFQECLSQIDIHWISRVQIPMSTDRKMSEYIHYRSVHCEALHTSQTLVPEEVPLLQDFLEGSIVTLCCTIIFWTTPEQRVSPVHLAHKHFQCRSLYT